MAIELFGAEIGVYAALACVVAWLVSGYTGIYRSQRIACLKQSYVRPASDWLSSRRGTNRKHAVKNRQRNPHLLTNAPGNRRVQARRFLHDIYHMPESCGNCEDLMEISVALLKR
jgi:hypothetical protein